MNVSKVGLTSGQAFQRTSPVPAPWISVQSQSVVSIEHPYIVSNIEKGIESLGGQAKLDNVRFPASFWLQS